MSTPAAATPTRARRVRPASRPLDRDAGLSLVRLEREITLRLADSECRASCAQLSEYLDDCHASERMDAALVARAIGVQL